MRISIKFFKMFALLFLFFLPILGALAAIVSGIGLMIASLENMPLMEGVYFAWITGLTIGYGDIVPTLQVTRTLCILTTVVGITFSGVIVAIAVQAAKFSLRIEGVHKDWGAALIKKVSESD